jgi:hypothetical protein
MVVDLFSNAFDKRERRTALLNSVCTTKQCLDERPTFNNQYLEATLVIAYVVLTAGMREE